MGPRTARAAATAVVALIAAGCGESGPITIDEPAVAVEPADMTADDSVPADAPATAADDAASPALGSEEAEPIEAATPEVDSDEVADLGAAEQRADADPENEAGGPIDLGFSPTDVRGLVTSTGIPVAVLSAVGERFVVTTPCGDTTVVGGGTAMGPVDVALDPGHGGPVDTGAVGPNGLVERDLNLRLAEATQGILDEGGVTAILTRAADYHTTLAVRSALADALGVAALVSIHHNAPQAPPADGPGTEIFVQSDSLSSARLGGTLYQAVVSGLGTLDDVEWQAAPDAGVLRVLNTRGTDAYGMIRRPATPTALVEMGYISNPSEAELFTSDEYIEVAAAALADGIVAYLETSEVGSGYVAEPRVFDPAAAPGADVCTDPPLGR